VPAIVACAVLFVSPVGAQIASVEALSQTQALSAAQKQSVSDWANEQFDAVLASDPADASAASRGLVSPFERGNVTAAFRFAVQAALSPRLAGDLDQDAPPIARFAALRMCGRVATSKVLPTLGEALKSEDAAERSFAIAAYADFFESAREESSPIRESGLARELASLTDALANEDDPTIVQQFIAVLAGAESEKTNLRLQAAAAMVDGLNQRFADGSQDEAREQWTIVFIRAIEASNLTYVQEQLHGKQIENGFAQGIAMLCAHATAFAEETREEITDSGDESILALLDDLETRATAVSQFVTGPR